MTSKFLACLAAVSLTVAPVSAQANTRAGDAGVSLQDLPNGMSYLAIDPTEFCGRDGKVDGDDGCAGGIGWLGILLGLVVVAGVIGVVGGDIDEGGNASPGTGG